MKRASSPSRNNLIEYISTHRMRVTLIGGALLLVVIIAIYTWCSYKEWGDLAHKAEQTRAEVKSEINKLTSKKQTQEQASEVADKVLRTTEQLCKPSALVDWQRYFISAADKSYSDCEEHKNKLSVVGADLASIIARAKSEQAVAGLVSSTHSTLAKLEQKEYAAQRQAWVDFRQRMQQLQVHSTLQEVKKSANLSVSEIVAAYDRLETANKDQERPEFDAAVNDIQKGYSKLGELQNLSVDSYNKLLDTLRKSAKML